MQLGRERFSALSELNAGQFAHLNGTLEQHLCAVQSILKSWGADPPLCDAGLYHAAYGTAGFNEAMVSTDQKTRIIEIIGEASERIVYRYCSCDRAIVWPQIGMNDNVRFHNRFTGSVDVISAEELREFCELTCANEVEIAKSDSTFVARTGDRLGKLFSRWSCYISASAMREFNEVFSRYP